MSMCVVLQNMYFYLHFSSYAAQPEPKRRDRNFKQMHSHNVDIICWNPTVRHWQLQRNLSLGQTASYMDSIIKANRLVFYTVSSCDCKESGSQHQLLRTGMEQNNRLGDHSFSILDEGVVEILPTVILNTKSGGGHDCHIIPSILIKG